jgi:hypothetical protein
MAWSMRYTSLVVLVSVFTAPELEETLSVD